MSSMADQAFDPTETNFSSLVSTIKALQPDAIALSPSTRPSAHQEMISQGIDTTKLYLVDGNTSDYSDTFDKGTLKGVTGTIPAPTRVRTSRRSQVHGKQRQGLHLCG